MSILRAAPARTLRVFSPAIPAILAVAALEPARLTARGGQRPVAYELLLKTPDGLNLRASGAVDFDPAAFIGRELFRPIELDGPAAFLLGAAGASVSHMGAWIQGPLQ